MATPAQKIKVGAFLLMSLGLIVGGFFLFSGYKKDPHTQYWVKFNESVLGLGTGGLVEYLGVPVGAVEDIRVDEDNHANVLIMVNDTKVTLREGVMAKLVLYNIASGTMAISLEGGTSDQPKLPAEASIPVRKSLMANFTGELERVLGDIGEVSRALNAALKGMEEGAVTQIVEEVHGLVTDSREFVAATQETMEELNRSVQRAMEEYTALGKDARGFIELATEKLEPLDVARLQGDLQEIMGEMSGLTERLGEAVATIDRVGETVIYEAGNIEQSLRESLRSATEAFDSINELASTLQENPSALVWGRSNSRIRE